MTAERRQKIVVVGAGPVGALAALYAAHRPHYDVEVYELRGDLRDPNVVPLNFTKSINLALSQRGITALKNATSTSALLDSILSDTIPMRGRMIHARDPNAGPLIEQAQAYDVRGRYIRAADRAGLNKRLLDALERMPNVKIFFNHRLTGADFRRKRAWLEHKQSSAEHRQRAPEIEISFDLMIGADGAHSAVRQHLMKYTRINYMQEYIDTLWCEFNIAPGVDPKGVWNSGKDGFAISPNHLHIWPAGSFMFIAIPSTNGSFTCTMFMSATEFAYLDQDPKSRLVPFFNQYFPGVAGVLISDEDLLEQYNTNPHLPLISIKCSPYHCRDSAVIVGDAAHAMVPFYGQGMNAGLEDVRVLFEILDKHSTGSSTLADALAEYTDVRTVDGHAINDLAMGNYGEMRSGVRSPTYLLRKKVEEWLSIRMPSSGFATQYSRVSFSDERYSEVVRNIRRQDWILGLSGIALLSGAVGGLGVLVTMSGWWKRLRGVSS